MEKAKIITLFSGILNDLIKEKGISLRKIEAEINIDHSTFSRWLHGQTLPQADYLWLLADYFGCTLDYLLGRE